MAGTSCTSIVRLPGHSSSTAAVRWQSAASKLARSVGSNQRVSTPIGQHPIGQRAARLIGIVGHQQHVAGLQHRSSTPAMAATPLG
jgi:hypothetical protein